MLKAKTSFLFTLPMLPKGVLFLQVNAPVHKSHIAMKTIWDLGFQLLEHPPYSPDVAPSDYHLFSQLKTSLKGHTFFCKEDE
jgi:histone-lysine N-methyltransferase SETMAR